MRDYVEVHERVPKRRRRSFWALFVFLCLVILSAAGALIWRQAVVVPRRAQAAVLANALLGLANLCERLKEAQAAFESGEKSLGDVEFEMLALKGEIDEQRTQVVELEVKPMFEPTRKGLMELAQGLSAAADHANAYFADLKSARESEERLNYLLQTREEYEKGLKETGYDFYKNLVAEYEAKIEAAKKELADLKAKVEASKGELERSISQLDADIKEMRAELSRWVDLKKLEKEQKAREKGT